MYDSAVIEEQLDSVADDLKLLFHFVSTFLQEGEYYPLVSEVVNEWIEDHQEKWSKVMNGRRKQCP